MPSTGQTFTLVASTTQTASGSGTVQAPVDNFRELDLFLIITAASGTTPSLTVKLQTSPDGGTTWLDVPNGAFSAQTAVGNAILSVGDQVSDFGSLVRAVWTISGTTPSFTFSVLAVGK